MSKTIRAFIAIEINDSLRPSLTAIQQKLQSAGADIKWVEPQKIHLTLKFLGDISPATADAVKDVLDTIASGTDPFPIRLGKPGFFPDAKNPRILWCGLSEGEPSAARIAQALDERLAGFDIKKEDRLFSAHLTLGRLRSARGQKELLAAAEGLALSDTTEQTVTALTLFQSELTPSGPIYTQLHLAPLERKG